ncbi:MAG: hypothetical protein AAF502_25030 [Bacteroidota bacterium]
MKIRNFLNIYGVIICLFLTTSLFSNDDLRLAEVVDGVEVLSKEIDIEFVFSAPRQQFSQEVVLVNIGNNDLNIRLKPGSVLKGRSFELKDVEAGFVLTKGERKSMEMIFRSANQNFVNWETAFIVVAGAGPSGEVTLNCIGRKDITRSLSTVELTAWDDARKLHSVDAYNAFLKAYPSSNLASEASLRISAIEKDSLQRNVTSTTKLIRADLEKAVKSNDEKAIRRILEKHDNTFITKGLEKHLSTLKERTVFETAIKSDDKTAMRNYLKVYPDGLFTYFIKDKLNEPVVIPNSIQEGLDELRGQLLYFIPDSMTVNEAYRVEMTIKRIVTQKFRIDKGKAILNIPISKEKLKTRDNNEVTIEIGKVMRAELIDSSPEQRFHVVPFGESKKLVDLTGKDHTLWQWDVVPLSEGRHYLNFLVEIIMTTEDGVFSEAIPVYKKKIYVEAVPGIGQRIGLIAGIIGGGTLGAFLLFFLLKKRRSSDDFVANQAQKIKSIPEKVTFLVKKDKLRLALVALDQFLDIDDELTKDVVLLKSTLTGLEDQIESGTASEENINLTKNRIRASILELTELIKKRSVSS